MSRVKGATHTMKRRRSILKMVKGYRLQRSKKERAARDAIFKAGSYAFRDRKAKKREFRQLWSIRINAALRSGGHQSYSKFIGALKKKDIALDRKILATLAKDYPEAFNRVVALAK